MKYIIYFEIYGKKMKTTVEADSPEAAKYQVMGKIKWYKIKPVGADDDQLSALKNIFGLK